MPFEAQVARLNLKHFFLSKVERHFLSLVLGASQVVVVDLTDNLRVDSLAWFALIVIMHTYFQG